MIYIKNGAESIETLNLLLKNLAYMRVTTTICIAIISR